jgi:hypothetical protein
MHATGIPVYIRNWSGKRYEDGKKVRDYHPGKDYTLLKDFYDVERML